MKVFSIALALAAILFVAYALPTDYEETPGEGAGEGAGEEAGAGAGEEAGEDDGHYEGEEEVGEEEEGGEEEEEATTPDPCQQFEKECNSNEQGAIGGATEASNSAGNGTLGNTTPSPQCSALQQQCAAQNNSTMPGGVTKPTPPGGSYNPSTSNPTQPSPSQPSQPTHPTMPTTEYTTPAMPGAGRRRR